MDFFFRFDENFVAIININSIYNSNADHAQFDKIINSIFFAHLLESYNNTKLQSSSIFLAQAFFCFDAQAPQAKTIDFLWSRFAFYAIIDMLEVIPLPVQLPCVFLWKRNAAIIPLYVYFRQ